MKNPSSSRNATCSDSSCCFITTEISKNTILNSLQDEVPSGRKEPFHSFNDREQQQQQQSKLKTPSLDGASSTSTTIITSPKPITAPPMNEKGKEFCLMLLDRLLQEHDLKILHSNSKYDSSSVKQTRNEDSDRNMDDHHLNDNKVNTCCCCCCDKEKENNFPGVMKPTSISREHWPQYITICGIGSLLSEKSAKRTFPELHNFRKAIVKGYLRTFNLVAISSLPFGDLEKRKVASVAAASHDEVSDMVCHKIIAKQQEHYKEIGNSNQRKQQIQRPQDIEMYCTAFEVPLSEEIWCAFMTREHRYQLKFVTLDQEFKNDTFVPSCSCANGSCGGGSENSCQCCNCSVTFQNHLVSCGCKALICCQYNDDLYKTERCITYENEFHERVARHYNGRIWYHTKDVHLESQQCTQECMMTCETTLENSDTTPTKIAQIPIKPISKYLELCFNAALELGTDVLRNFMYTSILADGQTLMEDYVKIEEPELYEKYSKYYL